MGVKGSGSFKWTANKGCANTACVAEPSTLEAKTAFLQNVYSVGAHKIRSQVHLNNLHNNGVTQ